MGVAVGTMATHRAQAELVEAPPRLRVNLAASQFTRRPPREEDREGNSPHLVMLNLFQHNRVEPLIRPICGHGAVILNQVQDDE